MKDGKVDRANYRKKQKKFSTLNRSRWMMGVGRWMERTKAFFLFPKHTNSLRTEKLKSLFLSYQEFSMMGKLKKKSKLFLQAHTPFVKTECKWNLALALGKLFRLAEYLINLILTRRLKCWSLWEGSVD